MQILDRDIALDMGTAGVALYVKGKGITNRQPTLVAVDKYSGKLLSVGVEALNMLGRTPASIVPIRPIVGGAISDYDMTVAMLRELLHADVSRSLFKPRVLVCVPGSITGVEERAMIDAVTEAGARKVYLVESAVATAYGAGLDASKPDGHLIIDIGGGTTETAVVSLGGVSECESIKTAGAAYDDAIIRHIRRRYNVLVGEKTAEELKMAIGSVVPRPETLVEEVKGRDLVTGLPKTVQVSSAELAETLMEPTRDILESIHMVLERTPPELVSDISQNGIIMSGGGSLIYGIDRLVERDTGIRTVVVDDPVSCAAYGAGKMLNRLNGMSDGMVNFARKRMLRA